MKKILLALSRLVGPMLLTKYHICVRGGGYISFEDNINPFSSFNMCYLNDMLGKALLAESLNCVPVFKVKNVDGRLLHEQFYSQIDITGLRPSYKNRGYNGIKKDISGPDFDFYKDKYQIAFWHRIYVRNFFLKSDILTAFESSWLGLIKRTKGKRVIGVEYRGTDYRTLQPKGHPRQPDLEYVFKGIKDNTTNEDYFFISTDEKSAVERFKDEFGERILSLERLYYDKEFYNEDNHYTHVTQVRFAGVEDDRYLQGFEYLREVYILSKCVGLIGSNCGATRMALIMNGGKYSILKIADLGRY